MCKCVKDTAWGATQARAGTRGGDAGARTLGGCYPEALGGPALLRSGRLFANPVPVAKHCPGGALADTLERGHPLTLASEDTGVVHEESGRWDNVLMFHTLSPVELETDVFASSSLQPPETGAAITLLSPLGEPTCAQGFARGEGAGCSRVSALHVTGECPLPPVSRLSFMRSRGRGWSPRMCPEGWRSLTIACDLLVSCVRDSHPCPHVEALFRGCRAQRWGPRSGDSNPQ